MKRTILLTVIFIFSAVPVLFSQAENKIIKDPATGAEILYGEIDTSALSRPPFREWFKTGLNRYEPETSAIVELINNMAPEYDYVIVMGTWCPDSRREVPRMLKVLYLAGVPESHIAIYAVDRKLMAKHTPVKSLDIERVPTLIISLKGKETGRIVESPKVSIEKDLLNIISGD